MARTAPAPNIPPIPGMNPATWIMGGGGAGGGSGASKGKGGSGKGGGNGEDGDEDPNGGGKGKGACGQGSPGACSNCGHNVAAGDPVDVSTGEVFTLPATDLLLPGRFNLSFVRSYGSLRRTTDVGLGYGWCHTLAWALEARRRTLLLTTGDGRRVELPAVEPNSVTYFGRYTILRRGPVYVIYPGTEFAHVFRPREPGAEQYELGWVRYRNRGHLALDYERGRLARVTDTVGREIAFATTPNGRIGGISVLSSSGTRIDFARYAYDDVGNLVAATNADGQTTRFQYGSGHQLTRLEHPNGLVFRFTYDSRGRCVETWGEYPGRVDPALAPGLPTVLADGTTRAKGIYHCRLDFLDDECTEVADSLRVRRFLSTPAGTIDKAVGGMGNVTTRVFDEDQNVIAQTDATEATWQWEYDRLGNVTRAIDPAGGQVRVERNIFGQRTAVTDQEGATTIIERDAFGEPIRVEASNGAQNQFVLDAHGTPIAAYDARGGLHEFRLDSHGNRIEHKFPNGAVARFEYDYFGRLVREVDTTGAERRLVYSPGGAIVATTDPLGRQRLFNYDAMGNLVRKVDADGSVHTFEYGGLNWMCLSRWPDGSEVRGCYNAEGQLLRLTNERGEAFAYEYDFDGRLRRETDPRGLETSYRHDALGRIVSVERANRKTLYQRNRLGQIVEATAPDDASVKFSYNRRGQLVEARSSEGVAVALTVDSAGWVVREQLAFEGQEYVVETERDTTGDRVETRTSLGHEVRTYRDANGLVSELRTPDEVLVAFARNAGGQVIRRDYNRGAVLHDEWDAGARLRHRRLTSANSSRRPDDKRSTGERFVDVTDWLYDYTTAGELRTLWRTPGNDVSFEYDVRRRLVARAEPGRDERFAYDPASNLFEQGPGARARAYGSGDLLLQHGEAKFEYDELGFIVRKVEPQGPGEEPAVTRYAWNGWGQLQAVELPDATRVEFMYDPFSRRVVKRLTRDGVAQLEHHYIWDLVALVHDVEVGEQNARSSSAATTYLYADGNDVIPIAHRDAGSATWDHYVADFNGVVEMVMDASGRTRDAFTRTAFGRLETREGGAPSTPFRHPGQMEDGETGLYYNRARYYDPALGRYISPDPVGITGIAGLNLYAYCPNPISWSDPAGLEHSLIVTGTGVPLMSQPALSHSDPNTGSLGYRAGRGGATVNSPRLPGENQHPLWPTAAHHSEQRFAHDLISQARQNPGRFNGTNFHLQGSLPPCPACHASMMRAAQESNAEITYAWGTPPNSITYAGGSGTPRSTSAETRANTPGLTPEQRGAPDNAQTLLNAYTHRDAGNWSTSGVPNPNLRHGPEGSVNRPSEAWGYRIPQPAWDEYIRQRNIIQGKK